MKISNITIFINIIKCQFTGGSTYLKNIGHCLEDIIAALKETKFTNFTGLLSRVEKGTSWSKCILQFRCINLLRYMMPQNHF